MSKYTTTTTCKVVAQKHTDETARLSLSDSDLMFRYVTVRREEKTPQNGSSPLAFYALRLFKTNEVQIDVNTRRNVI